MHIEHHAPPPPTPVENVRRLSASARTAETAAYGGGPIDGPALVTACLPSIDKALAFVCRRRRLGPEQAQELASDVYFRLLQNNASALRRYRGDSSLVTYLVVIVRRVLLDAQIARTGKWRPSACARRLGRAATLLERLVFADGLSLQEAAPLVRQTTGATLSDDEFHFLLSLLRPRVRRLVVDPTVLDDLVSEAPSPEDLVVGPRRTAHPDALAQAIDALSDDDRQMVHLRFEEGLTLRQIARDRQIDEKAIYRRFNRLLARLRTALQPI